MNELLARIVEAHGRLDRLRRVNCVEATAPSLPSATIPAHRSLATK